MFIIEAAFPRSGNTFLVFLFQKSVKKSYYVKLPREFKSKDDVKVFIERNSDNDEIFIFGHNHMHKLWEADISFQYNIPIIFIFRDPFECITSHLVLGESRPYSKGKNFFKMKYILQDIYLYNLVVLIAVFFKVLRKKHIVITFQQLVIHTEETVQKISDELGFDCEFKKEYVDDYYKTDFQKMAQNATRKKDRKLGYKIHLNKFQQLLIYIFCKPLFGIINWISR